SNCAEIQSVCIGASLANLVSLCSKSSFSDSQPRCTPYFERFGLTPQQIEDGRRDVVGMEIGTCETGPIWTEFLRKLKGPFSSVLICAAARNPTFTSASICNGALARSCRTTRESTVSALHLAGAARRH
ncbi:hypothetical protein GR204_35285, partial [Rhizobium leguminosarum]|nr:hypothetical protein [Rhizobium leguminosarum]NEI45882.1 hypothetical protein [Rhizobium leguminosarum]